MRLQEKISLDLKSSMINRTTELTSLLRVLISELNRIGKEVSDEQVLKVIKKLKDNAIEMNNDFEIKSLDSYLPSVLSDEKLEEVIKEFITSNSLTTVKETGKVMNELKIKYPSQYDGKKASDIIKKYLN